MSTLELLRSRGKQIIFVTNNSTKSRADYRAKLTSMGIPAALEEVFSSSYSSAVYISLILQPRPPKNKVFIIGEAGIETELTAAGIPHCGGTDPALRRDMTPQDYKDMARGTGTGTAPLLDPAVGIVLCGLDFHLNYLKLALAFHYIRDHGAAFLQTNGDTTLPSSESLFPGAGACVAPLVAMLGRPPTASLGKPDQAMMDAVEGKFQFDRKRTCMVGDRLDTDIAFGIKGGLGGTLCVLTGVTRAKEDWEGGETKPSFWVDRLGDLSAGA